MRPNNDQDPMFSEMSIDSRRRVLFELRKRLRFTAVASVAMGTDHWKMLNDMGEKLESECQAIAADYHIRSSEIVSDAIQLIADFQDDMDVSSTLH